MFDRKGSWRASQEWEREGAYFQLFFVFGLFMYLIGAPVIALLISCYRGS